MKRVVWESGWLDYKRVLFDFVIFLIIVKGGYEGGGMWGDLVVWGVVKLICGAT